MLALVYILVEVSTLGTFTDLNKTLRYAQSLTDSTQFDIMNLHYTINKYVTSGIKSKISYTPEDGHVARNM
jgi:hypothetical protein